jgi:hypothetical protein
MVAPGIGASHGESYLVGRNLAAARRAKKVKGLRSEDPFLRQGKPELHKREGQKQKIRSKGKMPG